MKKLVNPLGFILGFTLSGLGMTYAAQVPTISFTAPPDGSTVAGSIDLAVAVGATTACVQYQVDNQILGTSKLNPFGWTWDSKSVTDGPHVLKAIAEDTTGVDSNPTTRSVTVSNGVTPPPPPPPVLPTLTVSAITQGNSGNYTITVKLSQALSGLPVTIVVTWPSGTTKTMSSTITSGLATTQLKLKGQPTGIYKVQATTLVSGSTVTNSITFKF
jgi:hypothetical protein